MPTPNRSPASPRLAYATADLPGCGGSLRGIPEDFQVEELPAYAPAGEGEHLYLWIEKRGLSTADVVSALGRRFGVPSQAIGTAGKKDRRALTRQWISVHTPADPDPAGLGEGSPDDRAATAGFRVLAANRHGNKLRPGHLLGNRFTLTLRDVVAPEEAEPLLARLERDGFPNYFGPQRLGPGLANALAGRALLHRGSGGGSARHGSLERHRFAVNAYQGALFNLLVAQRLRTLGSLGRMLPGDLALLHRNGAAFPLLPDELDAVQPRADAHELSPSAPLFGYRTTLAQGQPGAWETALLERESLALDAFRLGGKRFSPKGERRPVRAFAADLRWSWLAPSKAPALQIAFTLAPGVYATSLLRELMKNDDLAPLPAPPESLSPAAVRP